MDWEKPRVMQVDMNAEIGAYQADVDDEPADARRALVASGSQPQSECARELAPGSSSE